MNNPLSRSKNPCGAHRFEGFGSVLLFSIIFTDLVPSVCSDGSCFHKSRLLMPVMTCLDLCCHVLFFGLGLRCWGVVLCVCVSCRTVLDRSVFTGQRGDAPDLSWRRFSVCEVDGGIMKRFWCTRCGGWQHAVIAVNKLTHYPEQRPDGEETAKWVEKICWTTVCNVFENELLTVWVRMSPDVSSCLVSEGFSFLLLKNMFSGY